jgi:hypothetical protein
VLAITNEVIEWDADVGAWHMTGIFGVAAIATAMGE